MNLPVTAPRRYLGRPDAGRRPGAVSPDPAEARDRSVRHRINVAWGLLYFNTLTYAASASILPVPSKIGKGLAQASLPLAILVILSVNPRLRIRPNVFLCLVSLLVVDTVITCVTAPHLGAMFRTFRLAEYVVALWLLTPWWGRRDMLLFRCHLRWLYISLGLVFIGLLVAPGHALAYDGRLQGIIWPMLPTQVAQYAALAIGMTVVLWLARLVSGRATLAGVALAMIVLLLTHTRTALVGLVAGLLVAGLSLFAINARVRKFFATGVAVVSVGVLTVAGVVAHLAGARRERGRADQPDRADQLLGPRAQHAAYQVPGDLRIRLVQREHQRPPHRQ